MYDKRKHICVAVLAHVDAGKTTLSEAMLYRSGSIRKAGRVDNGDAFLDNYDLERERGITIFSKQAEFQIGETEITLLDTPGHVDFSAEMERTLQVLDYAILLVSGADGIQGHTKTLWRLLKRYQIPVFLFVNKMDQSGTDREKLLRDIQENFGDGCLDFSRTEMGDFCDKDFYENVAMCEENALEYYLEQGNLPEEEIVRLIAARKLFPCFFGSALKMDGVEYFLESLERYMLMPEYTQEFGAKVFKITRDVQGNRLTYMKITGGMLCARDMLHGTNKNGGEWAEKVNQIRIYSGEKYEPAGEACAGMVCAVTGLNETYPGQGLGVQKESELPVLEPVLTYEIKLPENISAQVMLPKLRVLEEEEPELHIVWDEVLQEIQAQIMGEVQIEILKRLIEERFGIEVEFGTGKIVYRETIADTVEGVGHFEPLRHYAEVHLLLEPLECGSGLVFAADCSEDILSRNWQRLVLTHLEEKEHIGVLTGSAITDMKITLAAGRAHLKHTEGGDFRQATYRALRQGLMQAQSVLLEPYYEFRLELPDYAVGRAMMDIERMSGKLNPPEHQKDMAVLTGKAPVATMRDYAKEVTAYTKGNGVLSCSLSGYEPCHNTPEILAACNYDPKADIRNTPDSVFCAHGAGFVVSWDQVKDYMHLESVLNAGQKVSDEEWQPVKTMAAQQERELEWIGTDEIDRILNQTYNANKREKTAPGRNNWKLKGHSGMHKELPVTRTYQTAAPQLQSMRDEYLLVDGYNIIFAWDELKKLAAENIDGARGRLLDIMSNYQGIRQCILIVVFDAYRVQGHQTEMFDYHNIHVVYTKEAETADAYIEKFAHENGKKAKVTVATSDGLEQIIIRGAGCMLLSAHDLEKEVIQKNMELQQMYESRKPSGKSYLLDTISEEMTQELNNIRTNE